MKTQFITAFAVAAGIAALVSCQKAEPQSARTETAEPVQLTLRVSAAVPDSKTEYALNPAGTAINASWKAGDQISLIQLNSDQEVLSATTLTAKSTGGSVDFDGKVTWDAAAASATIIYPAIDPVTHESKATFGTKLFWIDPNSTSSKFFQLASIYNMTHQPADNVLPNLSDISVLWCNTSDLTALKSGTASVSLENVNYVIKAKLDVSGLSNIRYVQLSFPYGKSSYTQRVGAYGWCKWGTFDYGNWTKLLGTYLGTASASNRLSISSVSGIAPDSNGCITVYFVGLDRYSPTIDSSLTDAKIRIEAQGYDTAGGSLKTLTYSAPLTEDITFTAGYMYRLKGTKTLTE